MTKMMSTDSVQSGPIFSVIVPIYNAERYLEECVRSLQQQSLQDIELVLVDDGSPDCCGEIADRLALEDRRIKVVHRPNGGLGPARNSGIKVASGKYVGFVDSDDWVDSAMFETLANALEANDADICYSGIREVSDGVVVAETRNTFGGQILVGHDEIFGLRRSFYGDSIARTRDDGVPVSVCVAGYRRSMLVENKVKFETIRSEDILFNARAAKYASIVVVLNDIFYNYRQDRQDSITKAFKDSTISEFEAFFEKIVKYAEAEDEPYRGECISRVKKRVIDYARALGVVISTSVIDWRGRRKLLKQVASLHRVRWALNGFPIWKLSMQQAIYCAALSVKCPLLIMRLHAFRRSLGPFAGTQ